MRITPREKSLIRLAALGYSDKTIGIMLGITTNSVKAYMQQLRKKLGSFDRDMLPGIALLLNIVTISEITQRALEFLWDRFPNVSPIADEAEPAD